VDRSSNPSPKYAELLFAFVIFGGAVAGAVHDLIEIVLHGVQFLSRFVFLGLCYEIAANIMPN